VQEGGVVEAFVLHFDRVAQADAVTRAREERQEHSEVVGFEALNRGELPHHRSQLVAKLGQSLRQKALDPLACFAQDAAVGAKARTLDRERKSSGVAAAQRLKQSALCVL
jgi:hypothetical protein